MVFGMVKNVQAALKYRGGWKGLFQLMYTVSLCGTLYDYMWLWNTGPGLVWFGFVWFDFDFDFVCSGGIFRR